MNEKLEELKVKYLIKSNKIIEKHKELNIVYMRVSTKDKGQDEIDQWKNLQEEFKLDKNKCIIIKAKESAYKINLQKHRKINIIIDIIQELDVNIQKNCYFWSIDRIYRNTKLTEEFYRIARLNNTQIYSYRERFINYIAELQKSLPKEMSWVIEMVIDMMIKMFAAMAENESIHKSKQVKKSFKKINGRTYSNKNKLVGRKFTNLNGKKLNFTSEQKDKIENAILKRIKKKIPYKSIKEIFKKKDINISVGYITNIKKKYL